MGAKYLETDHLLQKAVLWETVSFDEYGKQTVSSATELDVRWEQGLLLGQSPESAASDVSGTVYVDQEVELRSILWLGEEDDLPADIANITNLRQVMDVKIIPDLKNRNTRYALLLSKYNDTLPEVV